jgi:hypothetical protein
MSPERKNLEIALGVSTISFGFLGLVNSYFSYCFFHYRNMQELSVSEFMRPDFSKKDKEYMLRGNLECSNPMDVSAK